jgi:hypothetical protein
MMPRLPFAYAARNLFRSRARLLQTVLGSASVVLLVMAASAINRGMARVLAASGSPRNVILVSAGSEESLQRSEVTGAAAGIAAAGLPGVAEAFGRRAVSEEIHHMTTLRAAEGRPGQALLRGVTPAALRVYPQVRLLEGDFPAPGTALVGHLAWRKLGRRAEDLRPGAALVLEGRHFTVAGTFAAPGTVLESEIWLPLGDLRVLAARETLSCLVLRLDEAEGFPAADLFIKQRLDLGLSALRESDYYDRLAGFFRPLRSLTWLTAGLIAAGAVFGGFNTLYAAFASRVRELATLQVLGFRRTALLISLVQESTLACLLGTLLASWLAVAGLDGRNVPFSIGTFTLEIGPDAALAGLACGLLLGLLGALPPALRCLRPALPVALRLS